MNFDVEDILECQFRVFQIMLKNNERFKKSSKLIIFIIYIHKLDNLPIPKIIFITNNEFAMTVNAEIINHP